MISRHSIATALITLVVAGQSVGSRVATADTVVARRSRVAGRAHKPLARQIRKSVASLQVASLPQYVSLDTIKRLRIQANDELLPALQPLWNGEPLKRPMHDLLSGPTFDEDPQVTAHYSKIGYSGGKNNGVRLAQAFPQPILPAPVRMPRARQAAAVRPEQTIIPHWVRYPLEFQLAGICLGTRAVDKDRFNRIDRYGLFALHGNPTAVVVPGAGGSGNIAVSQQPPEIASIFPGGQGGGLPDWASAITVTLDNNHVEWLYRRETYSMGFIVDRLGFVDAIVVAGIQCPIARTQLEDPIHTVKLGDDLRKVLFRYGYPDTIETYSVSASASVTTGAAGTGEGAGAGAGANQPPNGVPGGPPGAGIPGGPPNIGPPGAMQGPPGAMQGQPGAPGGAANGEPESTGASNGAYRTFELRYEQSYNVVFTIRNNRVVRIYIFGDPDFFNDQHRDLLRAAY